MSPPDSGTRSKPRAAAEPPRADSQAEADADFDPDLDLAPLAPPEPRPELADLLALSQAPLEWAGDVKPSDAQTYVKPTTLPRGLVAPTMDMASIAVRQDVDPRRAVTVPAGVLRAPSSPPPPPSAGAVSGDVAPRETGAAKRRLAGAIGALAAVAVIGMLARAATRGPATDGPTSIAETSAPTSSSLLASSAPPFTTVAPMALTSIAGATPGASSDTDPRPHAPTGAAAGTSTSTGAVTPKTPVAKAAPRSTADPYVDAGALPSAPASASPSVAPFVVPSSSFVVPSSTTPGTAPAGSGPKPPSGKPVF